MSWIGKLFGTDAAVASVLETGKEMLDDAFYTDAERAEGAATDRSEVRKMLVDWMANTQGQNLSRRLIAISVTGMWLFISLVAMVFGVVAIWVAESAKEAKATTDFLDARADGMEFAVLIILGFYFAAPKLGAIVDVAMAKLASKPK